MKRRGEHARREAEKTKVRGMPWDHDVAAARWKEDSGITTSATTSSAPTVAKEVEAEATDLRRTCTQ